MSQALSISETYYLAMHKKDVTTIASLLAEDVKFVAPLAQLVGKQAVLEAVQGFMNVFQTLTIRAKFKNNDQEMIVYDLECSEPIGRVCSAALMTIKDELITQIELFYDARPFV